MGTVSLSLFDASFIVLYGALFYILGIIMTLAIFNHELEFDSKKEPGKKIKYRLPTAGKKFIGIYNEFYKTLFYFAISIFLAPKIIMSLTNHTGVVEDFSLNLCILSISIVEAFSNLVSFIYSVRQIKNEKNEPPQKFKIEKNKDGKDVLTL